MGLLCVFLTVEILLGLVAVGNVLLNGPTDYKLTPYAEEQVRPASTSSNFTNSVYLMVKSGASTADARLPAQLNTMLKHFPLYTLYSDYPAKVLDEEVIDIFEMLPEDLIRDYSDFDEYKLRKEAARAGYNWDPSDVDLGRDLGWETDKYKNLPMLLDAYERAPESVDWFFMVDDDTYVFESSLEPVLRGRDPNDIHYLGSWNIGDPNLAALGDLGAKYAEEKKEPATLFFLHGGTGIMMSRGLVEAIVEQLEADPILLDFYYRLPSTTCCGDMILSLVIRDLGYKDIEPDFRKMINPNPFQGSTIPDTLVPTSNPCMNMITLHHITAGAFTRLHEFELAYKNVTFLNFFDYFIKPNLKEEKENWNNFAGEKVFTGDEMHGSYQPAASKHECKRACTKSQDCYMWRYNYDSRECSFDTKISAGTSLEPHNKQTHPKMDSGWIIDRIQEISETKCV